MKILQTIAGLGATGGGTSTCTYDLLLAMHSIGCDVDLLTSYSEDILGEGEEWIHAVPNDNVTPYGYSRNTLKALQASDYDIYHANGLWMHSNHATCAVARQKGRPYVITPHGMLYPEAIHRSYWKKWPFIQLFFKKDVREASCLHATCNEEMEGLRRLGYKGPIAVIPNPTSLPYYLNEVASRKSALMETADVKRFGFLGRLHPRKNVGHLLRALSLLPSEANVELVIMGKGDADYEQQLHQEVERLQLKNVRFAGFLNGREKYEELAGLSALFVPSDFENFGMIVTEALSVGTPVMATLGTPWQDLNTHHCGWWTDNEPATIAKVMQEVLEMPIGNLLEMGQRGRQLVAEKFEAKQVAAMMRDLYAWLLNEGPKPEFVYVPDYKN